MSTTVAARGQSVAERPLRTGPGRWRHSPSRRWHGLILGGLLTVTATVYSWNLAASGYSDYYSAAAKSMSSSWRAFFFGAFDPQSTITLDKLSGFLVPQALSARVFGFSQWSIALPQVVEGLVTVAAAYYVFCRWSGRLGGIVGAAALAFAPLMISMFSHVMEDALLTMCTTLALAAWQRSLDTGKGGYLILAAGFVGLGFQAKMAQAWLVLPALGVVYLMASDLPTVRKLQRLLAAGATTLAVSFSWMVAMALVPASQRPYFDGTTNNDVFSMVLGYNGVNRFIPNAVPGALGGDPWYNPVGNAAIVGAVPGWIGHTPLKFFLATYATQIGWLLPVALAGLVLGLLSLRPRWARFGSPGIRTGVLVCSALLLTVGGVLSLMSLPHTAYLAAIMAPIAGLTGIAASLLLRTFRDRASRLRFALPLTIAAQTGWCLAQLSPFPHFAAALDAPVAVLGFGGALALGLQASDHATSRSWLTVSAALGLTGALLAPLTWAASTTNPAYAGTANDAYGGPQVHAVAARKLTRHAPYGIGLDSNRGIQPTASIERRIYHYATAHSSARFALATDSWRSAAPLILEGRTRVLPLGGYTSRVPSPTPAAIRALVARGNLGFVLETPQAAKTGWYRPTLGAILTWVHTACRPVPARDYGGASGAPSPATSSRDRLYDCRGAL